SSRRRHTRCLSDWSSDVCSSDLTGQRLDYWDPNVFLAALLVGIASLVIVSLATAPEPANAMASLFGRLETSSDDDVQRPLLLVRSEERRVGEEGVCVLRCIV